MGEMISVWSPAKKTGKTTFLYMLVNSLLKQLDSSKKILVCCCNLNYGNLLKLFGIDDNELNIEDVVNLKLSQDNSIDLLKILGRIENVYFLGSKKTNMSYVSRNLPEYEKLIDEFRQNFDIVFFDTISGHENILTNMLLENSDYIINVINQDKEILDCLNFVAGKEIAFVVNAYRHIYPDVTEIKKLYNLHNVFMLPDSNELLEMKNKNRLAAFHEYTTEYNKELNRISEFILKSLNFKTTGRISTAPSRKVRQLFGWIYGGLKHD